MANIEKCIDDLKNAKDDSEKIAALFLVTKLVDAKGCSAADRAKLFDGIGTKFLLKLLDSSGGSDGSSALYKSVALSILSSFCQDSEIAKDPGLTACVPSLLSILQAGEA